MFRPSNRRRRRRTRAFIVAFILAVVGLMVLNDTVFAIADPDTPPNIDKITAYDGVLDAGDLLVVVEYDLKYASLPDEPINEAYLGRFFTGTTEVNSTEPYAFNDNGYGRGVFSMYWTAAQKATASIEFDNTNSEDYQIKFEGKVGVFPGDAPTTTATNILWQDVTNTVDLLHAQIKNLARSLEFDAKWAANSQDLISSTGGVDLLTAAGEEYFANAIPHLQAMTPSLFSSGVRAANFTEEDFGSSYSDEIGTFWDGTWVDDTFTTLATTLRVGKGLLKALFALFCIVIIVWFVSKLLANTDMGQQFGILTIALTLPMFAAVDMIPLEMAILVAFLAIIGLMWTFMLRRAGA